MAMRKMTTSEIARFADTNTEEAPKTNVAKQTERTPEELTRFLDDCEWGMRLVGWGERPS